MKPTARKSILCILTCLVFVLLFLSIGYSQQAPRVKGPRVWLDMDQKELDDAYDQSVYAPNQEQIRGRYTTNSEATRADSVYRDVTPMGQRRLRDSTSTWLNVPTHRLTSTSMAAPG